jgi:hypothetical protein
MKIVLMMIVMTHQVKIIVTVQYKNQLKKYFKIVVQRVTTMMIVVKAIIKFKIIMEINSKVVSIVACSKEILVVWRVLPRNQANKMMISINSIISSRILIIMMLI